MSTSEPRNPLSVLLLLASLVFAVTALAYAVVPVLEQKALAAGEPPPASAFRAALRTDGWRWLLYEVAVMIVLGVASMAYDRLRSLQKTREAGTIAPGSSEEPPS
jgi:hypothetical protein